MAPLVRGVVLSLREHPYVDGAVASGTTISMFVWRHVLPHTLAPLSVQATCICASAMITEAIISFIAAGTPQDIPSWGDIMAEGLAPASGQISLDGTRIDALSAGQMRPWRRRINVVFQDPFSSLNPRMKVRDLAKPLWNFGLVHGSKATQDRVAQLLDTVRLPRDAASRFPHELSGGQRQRIGIARAPPSPMRAIRC